MICDQGREAALAQMDVSRETSDRFDEFAARLRKWNTTINLVAKSTLDELWTRHILDSAQLYQLAGRPTGLWVDLGTGGGFPGLIVALLAQDAGDDLRVTCIEADVRKASFLRTTAASLGIPLGVLSRRIEEVPPQNADVLSARALTSLDGLLVHARRHLGPAGYCLFPKGRSWRDEVATALETWQFTVESYPSVTTPEGVVLKIGGIERV